VQYLPALLSTNSWLTLTDGFPAALDTNLTVFIQSNAVPPTVWTTNYSGGGGTNIGGPIPPGTTNNNNPVVLGSTTTGFYRVVRDGVHIFGLTNGEVLSGSIQQPIEFAVDTTDEIVGVSFTDTNQNPLIGAYATPGPNGGWTLNWDTSMETNGIYAIEAQLGFDGTNDPVVSFPVTVTVTNLLSFPNYMTQEFGYQMWIYCQTLPNADVEIDMYDENTNYLGSFFPISDSNGVISFDWNLTDVNGNPLSDTNYMGYFTLFTSPDIVSPAVSGTGLGRPAFALPTQNMTLTKAPLAKLPRPTFGNPINVVQALGAAPAGGAAGGGGIYKTNSSQWWNYEVTWQPYNWIIAAGDFTDPSLNPDADQIEDEIVYGQQGEAEGAYQLLKQLNVGPPGNSSLYPGLFVVNSPATRNTLLSYLASKNPYYANFFWFGHGNNQALGVAEAGTAMNEAQIASALDNVPLSEHTTHVAGHPYRFVWADACLGSAGTLCEAFAIPATLTSTNNFIRDGIPSRAFLGYTTLFHPDLGPDGYHAEESEIIYTLLQSYLSGKSGGLGNQYNLNALANDAHLDIGPFAGINYSLKDPPGVFGAGDLLYGDPW
ncbi:MAG TPA: hypothetical protein VMF08_19505, partial [Candidatus Sulfotelmatobacter sp.]|nr:hypothetical protein [Candidatus Sulfotelmatobacter sp.]